MIIVEGCDNTGKTSLINELRREFVMLNYVKSIGQRLGPIQWEQWIWYELAASRDTRNRIYDRFFFSELVYGPLLRGQSCLSQLAQDDIIEQLRDIQPLVILCERYLGDVVGTFGERKQMEGVSEHLLQIQGGYKKIVQPLLIKNNISYVLYDFKSPLAFGMVRQHVLLELQKGWKPLEH